MNITYSEYPFILYLSCSDQTAPDGLPFNVISSQGAKYLETATSMKRMLGHIEVMNGKYPDKLHPNYCLDDLLFIKIDSDDEFRERMFERFFISNITSGTGTILTKDGGQFVFMLLSEKDTLVYKNVKGRYMSVALFLKDYFLGFEEGIIMDAGGIDLLPGGEYGGGMDPAGYLSFAMIFLAYLSGKGSLKPIGPERNKTSELILQA